MFSLCNQSALTKELHKERKTSQHLGAIAFELVFRLEHKVGEQSVGQYPSTQENWLNLWEGEKGTRHNQISHRWRNCESNLI